MSRLERYKEHSTLRRRVKDCTTTREERETLNSKPQTLNSKVRKEREITSSKSQITNKHQKRTNPKLQTLNPQDKSGDANHILPSPARREVQSDWSGQGCPSYGHWAGKSQITNKHQMRTNPKPQTLNSKVRKEREITSSKSQITNKLQAPMSQIRTRTRSLEFESLRHCLGFVVWCLGFAAPRARALVLGIWDFRRRRRNSKTWT
jgi:hypothetical protein